MLYAKKFRLCGIDHELGDKLDIMFGSIIAISTNVWATTQVTHQILDELEYAHSNEVYEEPIHEVEEHIESSHSKC